MTSNNQDTLINAESSLMGYFHDAIERASDEKHLDASEHTLWYLTNLLHTYSRTEKFFDNRADGGTLTPLAEYYKYALEADTEKERSLYLQRLGDVAIFLSGLFAPALERKAVGVRYYMAMGENAYSCLADRSGNNSKDKALGEVFSDLSNRFASYVAMLALVSPKTAPANRCDELLQLFDQWQATTDPHIEEQLRQRGVIISAVKHGAH